MYKKKYSRKSYKPRRRFYKKKSGGWMNMAKKAFNLASKVAAVVNTEYKQLDTNITLADHTYNGTIVNLCNPAQGTAVNQRTGDSIKMKNLTFRGECARNAQDEVMRLIVFIDKENTINAGSDLLQSVGNSNAPFSPKKDNNKFDTKVLLDRTYRLTPDTSLLKVDFVLKLNQHLHFDAGSQTVDKNALKLAVFTQVATGGAKLAYYTRVTYVDN